VKEWYEEFHETPMTETALVSRSNVQLIVVVVKTVLTMGFDDEN
jgi:hypothetical protein